jgi:hypothetical protein
MGLPTSILYNESKHNNFALVSKANKPLKSWFYVPNVI